MNELALQWLTERASPPGTLAGALRDPQGDLLSHSLDQACPGATVEKIASNFDLPPQSLAGPALPRWSTWTFEQGQIRFVERPDGWRLVLIVRQESTITSALDAVSEEFLTTSFGNL